MFAKLNASSRERVRRQLRRDSLLLAEITVAGRPLIALVPSARVSGGFTTPNYVRPEVSID
jgi:hypothetical protein